ncbi:type II secretion system protein GspJ [Aquabacterium sp. J223]|uniref:type II secretion system protein GspJ n=1 Tax=Aquabacterium sp. J223 TaxID=2898431 RepID=UPI0021AE08CA|nr:type II secretion system protein GspJ [Aquabacterium sp. J223]UUX96520.1 type II secretion system protein GspJ [Aquabacterium sp. J223]
MTAPARHRARGFTLVEVLVALMVMAVMAAMAQRGVQALQTANRAGQDRMERSLRLATVLTQFEQDLAALYDAEAERAPPAVAFDGATLRLLRRTADGAQLVAWSFKGGRFLRWAGQPLLSLGQLDQAWQRSQLLDGSEREQVVALDGVQAVQVYFWWGSAWSNAQSTGNLAVAGGSVQAPPPPASGASAPRPPTTRQGVPRGVRLVLTLAGGGQVTRDVLMGPQP